MREPLIQMQNIIKVFPPNVVALDNVSVDFHQGEIHAIVGENGAGKSTLMKILYGIQPPDHGEIQIDGKTVAFQDSGQAIAAGIGMVHQEILLVNEYSVWENVVLGLEPTTWYGKIDQNKAREKVRKSITAYNFNLDVDSIVSDVSVAARQKVEILKLLFRDVSVLILDEPTSVLTPQEIPQLFEKLRQLRDAGQTILFISHHLDEVTSLSDRITVLRRGRKIATLQTAETTKKELAQMMVGREVIFTSIREPQGTGEIIFELKDLAYQDADGKARLSDINLTVQRGEIVGIAGVEGNGQLELVNTIMGLSTPLKGDIITMGEPIQDAQIIDRRKSIAFVSQDRSRLGGSLQATITENAIMTHHRLNRQLTKWQGRLLDQDAANQFTTGLERTFDIDIGSIDNPFQSLSGGNQQKLILGRELTLETPFILLDQPTRGLDVGSIEYIHKQILAMRANGHGILMISSDLDELFRIADRILVLHRGRLVGDLPVEETNIEEIGYLMLEGHPKDEIG